MPTKITIEEIKQQAKDYKKQNNVKHTEALNRIANLYGFNKFEALKDKANKNGGFIDINLDENETDYEKIFNKAINYAYKIGDKDECTDKHIAYVLSALYLGGSPLQTVDYDTPNPNLDFDSKKMIKLYELWDKVEEIVPKISKLVFKEIVDGNEHAYYFSDSTIDKTRDLMDMDFSFPGSNKIDNDKRILDTLSNIIKKHKAAKFVTLNMSDLMPKRRIAEDEIFKNLNELKEKGIVKSVNKDNNNITVAINPKEYLNF
mgnify:CR=1 FL=1